MPRKHLTELFPWLIPLRMRERLFFFYSGMRLDRNRYAASKFDTPLPYKLFETSCPLYNRETGFDMVFQDNKVFNLKLAAATLDRVLILPGETFSFWRLVRYADRHTPYKAGLAVINGKLTTTPGGGMCQMSNLLFWMFLHAPLTVVERHGHDVKDFPEPPSDAPIGVDATVSEGWLDLKVRNDAEAAFQISIGFEDGRITGRLLTSLDDGRLYEVINGNPLYYESGGRIFEEVDVIRKTVSGETGECFLTEPMYRNKCEIRYPLPEGTEVIQKG